MTIRRADVAMDVDEFASINIHRLFVRAQAFLKQPPNCADTAHP